MAKSYYRLSEKTALLLIRVVALLLAGLGIFFECGHRKAIVTIIAVTIAFLTITTIALCKC